MNQSLIQYLLRIGISEEAVQKAYTIYSEDLIYKVATYFFSRSYKHIMEYMFFKLLNDFAALTARTDLTGYGAKGKFIKEQGPKSMGEALRAMARKEMSE